MQENNELGGIGRGLRVDRGELESIYLWYFLKVLNKDKRRLKNIIIMSSIFAEDSYQHKWYWS